MNHAYTPDMFDLNDWLMEYDRKLFDALHYLDPSTQYDCYIIAWEKAGKPPIED